MAASEDQNRLNSDRAQDSELEQYGVWVKAGPEDVDESEAEDEAFALTDLGDEAFDESESDLLGFGQELDTDEDELDELDLEDLAVDESTDDSSAVTPDEGSESELADLLDLSPPEPESHEDDDFLTLDNDDFGLHSTDVADLPEESGDGIELEEPAPLVPDDGLELEELDLDDLTTGSETGSESIEIDDELPGDLDDLTLDLETLDVDSFEESGKPMTEEPVSETPPQDEADELELLELEPEETAEHAGADAPAEASAPAASSVEEDDELDLDALQLDDDTDVAELDLTALPGETDAIDEVLQEVSESVEDDLPELEVDDEMSDDLGLDEMFDDVGAVEDEMTESLAAEPVPGDEGRSAALLESIEHELSSIRTELADLKQELSKLKTSPAPAPQARDASGSGADTAGGFFEDEGDDDDETIALTGAELDNIMNTAEFTEQPGRPTELNGTSGGAEEPDEPQDAEEFPDVDDLLDSVDLDSPVQEITLEEAPDQTDTIDLDLDIDLETPEEEEPLPAFEGSDDEVEVLANMDIDAELADIEELEDTSTPSPPADAEAAEESAPVEAERPGEMPETDDTPEDRAQESSETIGDEMGIEEPFLEEPVVAGELPDDETPIPENLKGELRSVLNYMDKLLESLPEEKIQEFAASEHFKVYRRLFEELGLEQ